MSKNNKNKFILEDIEKDVFPEIRKNIKGLEKIKIYYESKIKNPENYLKIKEKVIRRDEVAEEAIYILKEDIDKLEKLRMQVGRYRLNKFNKRVDKNLEIKKQKEKKFNAIYDNSGFPKNKRKDAYKHFVVNKKSHLKNIKKSRIERYILDQSTIESKKYTKELKKELMNYADTGDDYFLNNYTFGKWVDLNFNGMVLRRPIEIIGLKRKVVVKIKSMFDLINIEKIIQYYEAKNLKNAIKSEMDFIERAYNVISEKFNLNSDNSKDAFAIALNHYNYEDIKDEFVFNLFLKELNQIDVFSLKQKDIFISRRKFRNKELVNIDGVDFKLPVFFEYGIFSEILSDYYDDNVFASSFSYLSKDYIVKFDDFNNVNDLLKYINTIIVDEKVERYKATISSFISESLLRIVDYSQRNYDFKRLNNASFDELKEIFWLDFINLYAKKINDDHDNYKREMSVSILKEIEESLFEDLKGVVKNYLIKEIVKIDYKESFPLARKIKRKFKFFMGETNSGKTYNAFNELVKAKSGLYLSPLRLLALEGQEEIEKRGKPCSMLTGEEVDIKESALFKSSTIEMLNVNEYVEAAVIDEVQMIKDENRGWAWVQAIIGCPAENIYLAGSSEVLDVVKEIVAYTKDDIEIIEYKRKSPLIILEQATNIKNIKSGTAIIAFSRRKVLALKEQLKHRKVSVIYGNLGPEIRKEEARKFREGETEILIATDAIAMGLNLPIETVLFSTHEKNIRNEKFEIDPQLVMQIAGRAGRYGIKNKGYVGSLNNSTLRYIKSVMSEKIKPYIGKVPIMPNVDYLNKIKTIIKTDKISKILLAFQKYADFNSKLFYCTDLSRRIELADIIDEYGFTLNEGFMLSSAPVRESYDGGVDYFEMYIKFLFDAFYADNERMVKSPSIVKFENLKKTKNSEILKDAEEMMHNLDLYNWFSNRYMSMFFEYEEVMVKRSVLNEFIIESLKKS